MPPIVDFAELKAKSALLAESANIDPIHAGLAYLLSQCPGQTLEMTPSYLLKYAQQRSLFEFAAGVDPATLNMVLTMGPKAVGADGPA